MVKRPSRGTSSTVLKTYMYPTKTKRQEIEIGSAIFVDPGIGGTGWAYFENLKCSPDKEYTSPLNTGVIFPNTRSQWRNKVTQLCAWFEGFIRAYKEKGIDVVVIEFPAFWASSATSFSSIAKGDLFKLTYLIGGFGNITDTVGVPNLVLVSPYEWKGQLPKEVVIRRIKNLEPKLKVGNHEADAVGMGYSAQGVL